MCVYDVKVVLMDVEGTTTSIQFVKEVLFPYSKQNMRQYVTNNWQKEETQTIVNNLLELPDFTRYAEEISLSEKQDKANADIIANFANYLIDKDLKCTPLKTLQGLIWKDGFTTAKLKGHVFDDVLPAFIRWKSIGLCLAIYSSGSIAAQKLLFGYSEKDDMLPYISHHFDTTFGHKQEVQSYKNITENLNMNAADILFLTDNVKEAEAAQMAGLHTAIVYRSGNEPLTEDVKRSFNVHNSFDSLQITYKEN